MTRVAMACLLLAACSGGNAPSSNSDPGISPNYKVWAGCWRGMADGDFGGVAADGSFDLPTGDPKFNHIDYVMCEGSSWPSMTRAYVLTGGPFALTDDGSSRLAHKPPCPGDTPTARPMFALAGWNKDFSTDHNRWWYVNGCVLKAGACSIAIDADPAHWITTDGTPGTADPNFAADFQNAQFRGWSFGASNGCAGYGHGVAGAGEFRNG